jgi:hypothetical protein
MVLLNSSFDKIDYDKAVVITNRILGTTRVKQSGYILKFPWDEVQVYKMTPDLLEQHLQVTDKQGKSFNMTVTINCSPKRDQIENLHKRYGRDYKELLIDSLSLSAISEVAKKFNALEVYSLKRVEVEISLADKLRELFEDNFIHFDSSLIRSVELTEDAI